MQPVGSKVFDAADAQRLDPAQQQKMPAQFGFAYRYGSKRHPRDEADACPGNREPEGTAFLLENTTERIEQWTHGGVLTEVFVQRYNDAGVPETALFELFATGGTLPETVAGEPRVAGGWIDRAHCRRKSNIRK